jgi:hypothetical protein
MSHVSLDAVLSGESKNSGAYKKPEVNRAMQGCKAFDHRLTPRSIITRPSSSSSAGEGASRSQVICRRSRSHPTKGIVLRLLLHQLAVSP